MNNTTLGNTSLLLFCGNSNTNITMIPNLASPILRLPVNIFILQLIISRRSITSEFYSLNEAIFEIIICFYDILGVFAYVFPKTCLMRSRMFFLGFIVTGRPCLLALICVERYLAVVKPVVFLRLKSLKYKVAMSGIIWSLTVFSCMRSIFKDSAFYYTVVAQIIVCCVVTLYSCITTLLVLKKPGPGEGGRQREGMSNIKLKAFRVILIITLSVIFMYVPLIFVILVQDYLTEQQFVDILNGLYTCTALSGFVQALLFLQRSGKLPFIKWP